MESCILEVVIGNLLVCVGTFYRPPSGNSVVFCEKIDDILSSIRLDKYDNILLLGDFNFDLLRLDNDSKCVFS